jgi:hypothetical protein
MVVTDIITELVRETGGDQDDTSLSTLWLSFITAALRRIPEQVRTRAIYANTSLTLTSGQRTVTLPSNFAYPKHICRVYDTTRPEITILQDPVFNKYYTTQTGVPQFARVNVSTIEFECLAVQDYTIVLDYYKDPSYGLTSSDGVERKLVEPVKEMAKYIYYFDYEEDTEKGQAHLVIANDLLNKIEEKDMEQEVGSHVSDE